MRKNENKKPLKEKRFIVRKYVMAKSASEAIRKEKGYKPDEVFVDEEWMKQHDFESSNRVGFFPAVEDDE